MGNRFDRSLREKSVTRSLGIFGWMLAFLLVHACPSVAATVAFFDGDLSSTNWTGAIAYQTGPAASFSAQQIGTGGNPNQYREVRHSYGGHGSIVTSHLRSGATYSPLSQGAIADIDFSADLALFDGGESLTVAYRFLVTQGDSIYSSLTQFTPTSRGIWTSNSIHDMTSADFSKLLGTGPATPDFSANGGLIQFGYWASNGTGNNNPTSTNSGLDNWSVTVTTAVPEPASSALLLECLGLLGFSAYRRKQKAAKSKGCAGICKPAGAQ